MAFPHPTTETKHWFPCLSRWVSERTLDGDKLLEDIRSVLPIQGCIRIDRSHHILVLPEGIVPPDMLLELVERGDLESMVGAERHDFPLRILLERFGMTHVWTARCEDDTRWLFLRNDEDGQFNKKEQGLLAAGLGAIEGYVNRITEPILPVGGENLTPREREVVALVARGATNHDVALMLGVTEQTVKDHLKRIFRKLGARTRCGAVARTFRLRFSPGL